MTRRTSLGLDDRWSRHASLAALLGAALLTLACAPDSRDDGDGDGDGNGVPDAGSGPPPPPGCGQACVDYCPGGTDTFISGVVTAPNGIDPIPGAVVYVPLALQEFPPSVECEICSEVLSQAIVFTHTAADGTFTLGPIPTPKDAPPGHVFQVVSQKGRFRKVSQIAVSPCTANTADEANFRLPGKNNGQDTIPNIAVATGNWDKMECVLLKLGLEEGSFQLYDGEDSGSSPYPKFDDLLMNPAAMQKHNIIFIDCGNAYSELLENPTVRQNVQAYVNAGGRLYVTDQAYGYIEQQEPWAGVIDFEPGPSGTTPEPVGDAYVGTAGITTEALVHDADMVSWLQAVEQRSGDELINAQSRVHIEHFLSGWAVQHQVPTSDSTKVWLTGNVEFDSGSGDRPLTTTHDVSQCGRWLYSSYHTLGKEALGPDTFPEYCEEPGLSPQERVLLYLILHIADCISIG